MHVHPMSNPRSNRAIAHLLEHLNAAEFPYPGTNLRLVYSIAGEHETPNLAPHQNPADQEVWAYFPTWPTYGTWLPGDERGWVEYRHGWQLPDPARKREAQARLTDDACLLDQDQRRLVELTIADHCRVRGWTLYTVNCRSNHVHVIVAGDREPKEIREQFKAWCTRRLKVLQQERLRPLSAHDSSAAAIRQKWWAERGSALSVNDEEGLEAVIHYVREAQDHADQPQPDERERSQS